MKKLIESLRASGVLLLICTLLLGVIYPLLVTAFAQMLFNNRADGSLIERQGKIMGSEQLGQAFERPQYFWGRLSATTPPYNAVASGGSNLNPDNPQLLDNVNARVSALQKADPGNKKRIPIDLVTASGSGLDPHISPAAAAYQVPRVARARNMKEEEVRALVAAYTENPALGFIGKARVNVLELNLALDGK
jgi:potassium-transporting ATPase KdpC subunit